GVGGAAHDHRVQEVRAAPHHAGAPLGPGLDHRAAPDQVVHAPRLDVRQAEPVAGRRRDVGHLLLTGRFELEVVEGGHRANAAAEAPIAGDVGHTLAVDPDLSTVAQPLDVRGAAPGSHRAPNPAPRVYHRISGGEGTMQRSTDRILTTHT